MAAAKIAAVDHRNAVEQIAGNSSFSHSKRFKIMPIKCNKIRLAAGLYPDPL